MKSITWLPYCFTFHKEITLTKDAYCFEDLLLYISSGPCIKWCWCHSHFISSCIHNVVFVDYKKIKHMSSGGITGITFVQNVKICHLVQKLKVWTYKQYCNLIRLLCKSTASINQQFKIWVMSWSRCVCIQSSTRTPVFTCTKSNYCSFSMPVLKKEG